MKTLTTCYRKARSRSNLLMKMTPFLNVAAAHMRSIITVLLPDQPACNYNPSKEI